MSAPRPTGGEQGFTLLEALIAAAVLAAISALLAPALVGALNAASRTEGLTRNIEDRAALEGVMHELFASSHQLASADTVARFAGSSGAASFMVRPKGGAVQLARLELSDQALTLSLSALETGPEVRATAPVQVTLAQGFESGQLSYIGVDREQWRTIDQSSWAEDHPPRLVVLRLDWPDGSQTRIQSRVAGEGRFECRFDSGRGLCLGDIY